jgi:5'-3' exonuclease
MFCWDGGQKRPKERAERPKEYEDTKPGVKEALEALLGTRNVRLAGLEADDVIATAAFASLADHVIVVSGDKDLLQLQGGNVSYYDIVSKGFVSTREILARFHIRKTSQVAIALAVQGDSSDKIPGIRGWGPKKVEALFEHIRSDMPFDKALDAIDAQIPDDKKSEFYDALELTLLNTNIKGVPGAEPLRFTDPKTVIRLGLDDCLPIYRRLLDKYR